MSERKAAAFADMVRGPFDQSTAESGRALAAGMSAWFSTLSECQREMTDFVTMRLSKDGETLREMLSSRSPTEAMEIHSRWIQDTLRDYGAETTKMLAIYTKNAADAVQKKR